MPINYDKYPPNWKEIRQRILKRSENESGHLCCEVCGVGNYSVINKGTEKVSETFKSFTSYSDAKSAINKSSYPGFYYPVVLTIAHLDHDAENWNVTDDRLKAMCQSCHLKYDAIQKGKKRKSENAVERYSDSMFPIEDVNELKL